MPQGPVPVAISEIIDDDFSDCVIKKVKMTTLCVRVIKNGGDDPRAGQSAAEACGCYKVKCEGVSDGSVSVDDQFATRSVQRKGPLKTLCTPVELPIAVP